MGFPQNEKLAVKYYQLAADQDNAVAMNNLALMYEEGLGIAKNTQKAIQLYEKALALGDDTAAYNLGDIYFTGDIATKDYKKSVYYHEYVINNSENHELLHDSLEQLIQMYETGGHGLKKNLSKVKELEQLDIH